MNWSKFVELEKSLIKDKDSNTFEKVFNAAVIGPVVFAIGKADKVAEDLTGKGIIERKAESIEKEEKEKEEHPIKWAVKKIAEGAAKGIAGGS